MRCQLGCHPFAHYHLCEGLTRTLQMSVVFAAFGIGPPLRARGGAEMR